MDPEPDNKTQSKLEKLLDSLEDWEKQPTNIPGVRIIKIPSKDTIPPRLGVEINPVDKFGRPIKKTGAVVLTNQELFEMYVQLFSNSKVHDLIGEIEEFRKYQKSKFHDTEPEAIFKI